MPLRMRDSRPHAKTKLPFLGSTPARKHFPGTGIKTDSWTERLSPRAPGSEVGGELGVSFRSVGMRLPAGTSIKETTMSPLRARMIEDMTLAGLAVGTQKIYIQAVR